MNFPLVRLCLLKLILRVGAYTNEYGDVVE